MTTGTKSKKTVAPPATAAVRGSRTGRPVMALLDLLGRRWTMRGLWELRDGRRPFRMLQDASGGISPAVLNDRLRELREDRLVDLEGGAGYGLTPLGTELLTKFSPIVAWADKWAKRKG